MLNDQTKLIGVQPRSYTYLALLIPTELINSFNFTLNTAQD